MPSTDENKQLTRERIAASEKHGRERGPWPDKKINRLDVKVEPEDGGTWRATGCVRFSNLAGDFATASTNRHRTPADALVAFALLAERILGDMNAELRVRRAIEIAEIGGGR